jgi:hypothetical protein
MGFLASEQNYLYTTKTKVEAAEDETWSWTEYKINGSMVIFIH